MVDIKYFKKFVDELACDNSRNYKINVIEKYKEFESVKYFLNYLLNPFIVVGISRKKLVKDVGQQPGTTWPELASDSEIFEYLKLHNTGTDIDIWTVQQFKLGHIDEACSELFDRLITKDLPLGIDAKTVNKVLPGFIPAFNVMLATKYFDKPEVVAGKSFALTTKIDGMRCIMMKENGKVSFWSRQGQPIEGLVDLIDEAACFPDSICLDGELVAKVNNIEDTYKQTIKTARTKNTEKHGLKMMVFDCLPLAEFKNQTSLIPYWQRRDSLDSYFSTAEYNKGGTLSVMRGQIKLLVDCPRKLDFFEQLPILYQGDDVNKITEILNAQVAAGQEGIMVNLLNAPYAFKRTNSLLKCKLFNDCELCITGFENGINKYSNTLGALICDYNGYVVNVGSGFTDEERDYIWNHQDEYIGKLITVKYFEETTNADGGRSLRFPIYQGLRIDL